MDLKTNNNIVDEVGKINISGNVIPINWYKALNNKDSKFSGKIRLLAINILADIVYWYRPTEIRDEKSGCVIGYKKKFKADLLQRNYDDLCQMFMCSKKDAQRALTFLESFGVIQRVFRTMKISGITISNVLFIKLVPEILKYITYPSGQNSPYTKTISSIPTNTSVQTNTDNTTDNTTNTTLSNKKERKTPEASSEASTNNKRESKRPSFNEIIDSYTENEDLREELREHLRVRKAKGTAITNGSLIRALSSLDKLADNTEDKIIIVRNANSAGRVSFFRVSNKDNLVKKHTYDYELNYDRKPSYSIVEYESYSIFDE